MAGKLRIRRRDSRNGFALSVAAVNGAIDAADRAVKKQIGVS
jgi:hypothetical protein